MESPWTGRWSGLVGGVGQPDPYIAQEPHQVGHPIHQALPPYSKSRAVVGGFSNVLDRRGNSLSQNGIAILATISSTHYLLSTSSKQRNKCSRIELKMTETEQSNCIDQSAPFAMQLALRLCFCQMPIASITNGFTETLNCSGGVTRQKPPTPKVG